MSAIRDILWLAAAVCVPAISSASARIPLCPGLQIVTAVSQPNGDYESIKTVLAVDERLVTLRYSAEQLSTDFLASDFGQVRKTTLDRSVRRADLEQATSYQQRFLTGMPELVPETTAIGTSQAVLGALKSSGRSSFSISNAYSGEYTADRSKRPNLYDFMSPGELSRIDAKPASFSVIVNDVAVALPVVRARGDFGGERAEFVFLDDPANPLTLQFRVGIDAEPAMTKEMTELCRTVQSAAPEMARAMCGRTTASDRETLQVVKIVHRCAPLAAAETRAAQATSLERELAETRKATVYDIHFSFNSDRIREESVPRLKEIAAVMRRHSDWTLTVNGHTDSVGGEAYNLDLSRRRAAAVKQALVQRHGIEPARLVADGFGASQPRDTNATLAGRARNRRVELIR